MAKNPEPERSLRFSPDMIAALSAVLIGVCALGISLYQASIMREQSRMMREQQRAAVWPNLAVENSHAQGSFRLRIENTGIGPAKIGPVRVLFDREPIRTWTELILEVYSGKAVRYMQSQVGNRVLPAGRFETVFSVSEDEIAGSMQAHIERLTIEICYCSIYDECWLYTHGFDGEVLLEEVLECRATEADFLQ